MSPDLQEHLAVRLQNVAFSTSPDRDGLLVAEVASALADECIRQMEWARRRTVEVVDLDPKPLAGKAVVLMDLTLAPEDFQP